MIGRQYCLHFDDRIRTAERHLYVTSATSIHNYEALPPFATPAYLHSSFVNKDLGMFPPPRRAALPIFPNKDSKPHAGATVAVLAAFTQ